MLCKIADLLVEVPATGDMPQRCENYLYTGEGQPDIVIDASEYNPERWPTLEGAGLAYMESGTLFFLRLLKFNGMMLHSSAIEYEGKAYLFSGRPGMGKSTHTRLWRQLLPGTAVDAESAVRGFLTAFAAYHVQSLLWKGPPVWAALAYFKATG